MSNESIRALLARLHEEVQKTDVDANTRESLQELDSQIHDLLESSAPETAITPVLERAKLLETQFAIDHPAIERFISRRSTPQPIMPDSLKAIKLYR